MFATSTFNNESSEVREYAPEIKTECSTFHVIMHRRLQGDIEGRSQAFMTTAFNHDTKIGTALVLESFEGKVNGRSGTFNFAHIATSNGDQRTRLDEMFVIVPGSGTGELAGIRGKGTMVLDEDGTHHINLEYELD